MAFPEYRLTEYRSFTGVRESDRWYYSLSKRPPFPHPLESEIDELRRKMELLVNEGMPFTSSAVVEMSSLLDRKINEYMKLQQKSR